MQDMHQVNQTQFSRALTRYPVRLNASRFENGSVVYRDARNNEVVAMIVKDGNSTMRYLREAP